MNEYFSSTFSTEDLQQQQAPRRHDASSNSTSTPIVNQQQDSGDVNMLNQSRGDSLDDIIMQNNKELKRRQSMPRVYTNQDMDRRSSMMEFRNTSGGLNGYQYGTPDNTPVDSHLQRQSSGVIDIARLGDMGSAINISASEIGYSATMQSPNTLHLNNASHYTGMSAGMMAEMMYTPLGMDGISEEDGNSLDMFSSTTYSQQAYGSASMDQMAGDFMMASPIQDSLPQGRSLPAGDRSNEMVTSMPRIGVNDGGIINSPQNLRMTQPPLHFESSVVINGPITNQEPQFSMATMPPTAGSEFRAPKPEKCLYQGIYSQSGFDMLGALMKVHTRKNPEINIGKVDLSCAFVVCDISQYDCPIIYVSDIFERLTGYNKHEVKGQNCRFLQSPEGKVEAGAKRGFVDNESVYYLKNKIAEMKEAQRSLINYRKGGQPFMNLLTMIPITGEDDETIRYYVGFQVDLVEKPTSVEGKNASGLYTVDYTQGQLPRYVWQPPEGVRSLDCQTISRDDVSMVLGIIDNGTESETTRRMWDKILLENTDDVIHVLSLKGLFLYLSPSSRQVLEYDASELVGTTLSSVCHPSDIVPVTRELKDASSGASVNVVFRIRRKKSGYTWFESHGSLCVEQGKGRKCIILVGRERPVYALHRHELEASGGIGESEMWTKLSTSGMFLFLPSNVRNLLNRSPDELVGTSIQELMRIESKVDFGRSLEKARTGKRVTHKHEILNKRGLVLQAQTTLYPGDASEGQKPTFLVAQTRLMKNSSRSIVPTGMLTPKSVNALATSDAPSGDSTPQSPSSSRPSCNIPETSISRSNIPYTSGGPITQAGSSGLPIGSQDVALASASNIFDELKTTRCTSWQFELRQMEKANRVLAEELATLIASKKKRKRRKGAGLLQRDCANCHTRVTPEWRRGPSGNRDLCNSCGLRWAKQTGRVSPRTSTRDKHSVHSSSPNHISPLQQEIPNTDQSSVSQNAKPNRAPDLVSLTRTGSLRVKGPIDVNSGHGIENESMKAKDGVHDMTVNKTVAISTGSVALGPPPRDSVLINRATPEVSREYDEGGERNISSTEEHVIDSLSSGKHVEV